MSIVTIPPSSALQTRLNGRDVRGWDVGGWRVAPPPADQNLTQLHG
jgi:hypothetical protein